MKYLVALLLLLASPAYATQTYCTTSCFGGACTTTCNSYNQDGWRKLGEAIRKFIAPKPQPKSEWTECPLQPPLHECHHRQ